MSEMIARRASELGQSEMASELNRANGFGLLLQIDPRRLPGWLTLELYRSAAGRQRREREREIGGLRRR